MRNLLTVLTLAFLFSLSSLAEEPPQEEQWKGTPYSNDFALGVLGGIGHVNGTAGFSLPLTVSAKIAHEGFLDDINDQVHIELAVGPLFVSGGTVVEYSLHMRWDFHKNYLWSLYAVGGFGGKFSGSSLGSIARLYPRTGVGVMYNLFETVSFRTEFSHELIGVGVIVLL